MQRAARSSHSTSLLHFHPPHFPFFRLLKFFCETFAEKIRGSGSMNMVQANSTPISSRKELWSHKESAFSSTRLPIKLGKFKPLNVISEKKKLNGRRYKEWLKLNARRRNAPGPMLERKKVTPGDCNNTEAFGKTGLKEGNSETCHNLEALDGEAHQDGSQFVEYWVPVQLSDVQREQYCASLLSNSLLLCSYSKNDSAESLLDILISSRKCCDHPYLVDRSIRSSVIHGVPVADQFNAEIEISGKLQLLDKFLLEIKNQGLRVLIVFQKLGVSGLVSIGDILDDFIHEKYGIDSYARIDEDISRLNKQDAVKMFNNKNGGTFVCLIENRACISSIKLLSVDIVILFDSDWDPFNDIRAVQKITTHSEFEQLKIFRLYSCCTVEEKILILAKQGMTVDSNYGYIKEMTCQKLLTWGACYQFSKLNYYGDDLPALHSNVSSEHTLFEDVLRELSALLRSNSKIRDFTNCSVISKVQQSGGTYLGNMSLLGELKTQSMEDLTGICHWNENKPPGFFWRNLLKGRRPRWKHLPTQSRKIRRKFQVLTHFFKGSQLDSRTRKKLHSQHKKRKFSGASRLSDHHKSKSILLECLQREVATSEEHDKDVLRTSTAAVCGGEVPRLGDSPIAELFNTPSQDNSLPLHQENDLVQPLDSSAQPRAGSSDLQLPTSLSVDGSNQNSASLGCTSTSFDRENNHHVDSSFPASEVSQPGCLEPLQMEIDKIQKEKEQAIALHEEMKMQLQSECEKEIQEIRKKYDLLLQNAEMEFLQKRQDIETFYNKVYMNKLLAGAVMEKYNIAYAAGLEGTQKVTESAFMEEMCVLYLTPATVMTSPRPEQLAEAGPRPSPPREQFMRAESHPSPIDQATARSNPAAEQSPRSSPLINLPPATSEQDPSGVQHNSDMTISGYQNAELQAEAQSSGLTETCSAMTLTHDQLCRSPAVTEVGATINLTPASCVPVLSSGHRGQLSIPTIRYSGINPVGCQVRAPAPHLRNTRCPPVVLTSNPQISSQCHANPAISRQ